MPRRKSTKWVRHGATETDAGRQLGVSKNTVAQWKKKGWAVMFDDGSLDVESTARRVEKMRDPRGTKRPRLLDPVAPPVVAPPGATLDEDDLLAARTRKERALADKGELDVLRLRGELVQVEEARRVYVSVITAARVAVEAVPARVAPQILGLTSVVDVRRILQVEIASALRSLPNDAPRVD